MARRILLVDDEPLIVKGLKYSLEQEGYETESAADGEEALTRFFGGQFDLILLDVMLPKMDGIEVCQRIREKSNVPIIMLTAKGEEFDKLLGLELGAHAQFRRLKGMLLCHGVFRTVDAVQNQLSKEGISYLAAHIKGMFALLIRHEDCPAQLSGTNIDIFSEFDIPFCSQDKYPSVAPVGQSIRSKPVYPKITSCAIIRNQRSVPEIIQLRIFRMRVIGNLAVNNLCVMRSRII